MFRVCIKTGESQLFHDPVWYTPADGENPLRLLGE